MERFIRDFADRACKGYSSLVRAQSTTYRDRLNAVLDDAPLRGEYLGVVHVRVSKNGIHYK